MIKDLGKFFVFFFVILACFTGFTSLFLGELEEFKNPFYACRTLFEMALGNFDLTIYENLIAVHPYFA